MKMSNFKLKVGNLHSQSWRRSLTTSGRSLAEEDLGLSTICKLENGTEVAVKKRSQSSSQGTKEFMAEAQLLIRIHHGNLVSLVGYCNDGNCLALIYEYMSEGSLEGHLRGKAGQARILCWGERLRIALEAAQGLEYLHKGCNPSIIHRDVKTSNILLNKTLVTKIADFGLSKVFHNEASHVSTAVVVGTLGYLDPEYYYTYQLTQKSDVYSFGVVLLELITGQPAILPAPDLAPDQCKIHITQWVQPRLARGDIADLVDARLESEYDVNSVWKAADVAMKATAAASVQRPTMANVVAQLKEALALEAGNERSLELTLEAHDTSESREFVIAHGNIPIMGGPSAR